MGHPYRQRGILGKAQGTISGADEIDILATLRDSQGKELDMRKLTSAKWLEALIQARGLVRALEELIDTDEDEGSISW